ncbi:hypothetical protein F5050DRAFT_168317 [Lentinula boryana]|uniref:F-box domain-containing protein n=1 Tax=Lentinula boryana TaxID=40481 RepID=A0ABQ8QCD9_9AGAR|nr:hypothetical protein F5050DRAFT_168317 [Lentinula boryana]
MKSRMVRARKKELLPLFTFHIIAHDMLNTDLISLICEELEPGTSRASHHMLRTRDDINCRKGLLSLALTSKAFLEPALNVLWRQITSVEPLLSVLPDTMILNGKKMIVEQIAPSSWDRLHYYARKVREFEQQDPSNVHESVYAILGQSKPIFPNLVELRAGLQISTNSLIFFLTSSISNVSIPWLTRMPSNDLDLGPSLALLASKNPGLKFLSISSAAVSGISSSLRCFRNLRTLVLGRLPQYEPDYVQILASLDDLTSLTLTLPRDDILEYGSIQNGFPSLERLSIVGFTSNLRKFLKVVSPSILQDLSLEWVESPVLVADAFSVTNTLRRFPSLQKLKIERATSLFADDLDRSDYWALFTPLLQLNQLQSLTYSSPLILTDELTARIASSWPHIVSLYFNAVVWLEVPPVSSLAHFVRGCRNLRYLRYPIQVDVPTGTAPPEPTLFMHPLWFFHCSKNDDVSDPPSLALALHQLFPDLKSVTGDGDGWDEVEAILKSYHFILAQDRRFN